MARRRIPYPSSTRRFLLTAAVVVASVGVAAFSVYLIGLDREVRTRFAGARWALPAQVYSSPLELYPGAVLSIAQLEHELERLGYRHSEPADNPGTFSVARGQLKLVTRPFTFWDGPQRSGRYSVSFDGPAVFEVRDLEQDGRAVSLVRLDPMLIGSIYPRQGGEDRILVRLADVPPLLPQALIQIEDNAFYYHFGIDPMAVMRAVIANLKAGRVVQGASTITQQLVKNFFLDSRRTWGRKINEAFMALLLELHYSKEEILEAYLNEINLGQEGSRAVHGFGLASQFYFSKPLAELQPHEIALLVALPKGASQYNPRSQPERAKARRDLVLTVMAQHELLTTDEYKLALAQPLRVAGGKLGAERYPAFVDLVRRQLRGYYQETDLEGEGLRIFTTLDPRAQEALENRVREDLPALEASRKMKAGTLEAAGVVTTVEGGEVLALVGGRETRYAGFNRALDSQRPIGSLAKPFVYLAALSLPDRYGLYTYIDDEPVELKLQHGAVWKPQNYDKQLHGTLPLYVALAQSYNLATVRVGLEVGVKRVLDTFRAAGYDGQAQALPAIMLGALDASPLQVAQLYATLASGGYQAPLIAIREVTTKEGEPLKRYNLRVRQTLPEGPVVLLNWGLEQVLTKGTARAAYGVVRPSTRLAGKTGTTDDFRDSWFAGFGADRVAVIWVGRDDNKPTGFSGAAGALPVWARLMRDLDVRGLEEPVSPQVETVLIDPGSGMRADDGCPDPVPVPYIRGYEPRDYAPCADQHFAPLQWFKEIFE